MQKYLTDQRISNTWEVIKIEDLPENFPVIVVTEVADKSLAEFHLAQYCLIPKNLVSKLKENGLKGE